MLTETPTLLKPKTVTTTDLDTALSRSFLRAFERAGANPKSILDTFHAALDGLRNCKDKEARLRKIARAATISTGRCHGNMIETGRILLDNIAESAGRFDLDPDSATGQVLLGVAEGTCQIAPIAYSRFLEVACDYRDDGDTWILRNRRLPVISEIKSLPAIVPYENNLTIKSPASKQLPESQQPEKQAEGSHVKEPAKLDHETPESTPEKEENWSRPKQKRSIFARFSDVLGSLFSS